MPGADRLIAFRGVVSNVRGEARQKTADEVFRPRSGGDTPCRAGHTDDGPHTSAGQMRFMQEDIDIESHHIREVYAEYGYAMYRAQCLERGIAIFLTVVCGEPPPDRTRSMYQKELESRFTKTFGGLVSELRKIANIPPEFEIDIKDALKKRNWLAHDCFWDRATSFLSRERREMMIQELRGISDLFAQLDGYLQAITTAWGKKHGITPQMIKEEMARFYR